MRVPSHSDHIEPLAPEWLAIPEDLNALDPSIWPDTATRNAAGAVEIGGVSVVELAETFGTPLYVVDRATAVAQATRIRDAFANALATIGTDVTVYYASKALLTSDVVRWMRDAGLNVDVSSGGELAIAVAAGMPPQRIGLHGNNKSYAELRAAVGIGLGTIVVDSLDEIDLLQAVIEDAVAETAVDAAAGSPTASSPLADPSYRQRVRLRVTTGVHASTHEFLATAREDQKFGVALADVDEAVRRLRAIDRVEFVGMHSHIGSQIFDALGFDEAITRLIEVQKRLLEGGPVPELNLGGGFGIAYTEADQPRPIEQMAENIASTLQRACFAQGVQVPHIAIEPGRSIVGRAGVTLYETGTIKDVQVDHLAGNTRRYIAADGGMSDNPRPELYDADYQAALASRTSDAEPVLVRVVGKHCESGDIVVQADYLPEDVRRGDLLAVPDTGAYCFSLSSNYNMLPRPAVVGVWDGAAHLLVHGESIETLLRRDAGLEITNKTEDR